MVSMVLVFKIQTTRVQVSDSQTRIVMDTLPLSALISTSLHATTQQLVLQTTRRTCNTQPTVIAHRDGFMFPICFMRFTGTPPSSLTDGLKDKVTNHLFFPMVIQLDTLFTVISLLAGTSMLFNKLSTTAMLVTVEWINALVSWEA
jgi:hypothetical protein